MSNFKNTTDSNIGMLEFMYMNRRYQPANLKFVLPLMNVTCTIMYAGNEGYRPVYFPADTASRFEEVASPNTRKNVETCGILAGKLVCLLLCHMYN